MQIFADHFYEKGHSHSVCQDYALSQNDENYAFFVISDGCGSATNSEIGSMVMAHSLKAAVELTWYSDSPFPMDIAKRGKVQKETLDKSNETRRILELNPESLYATLMLGFYEKKTNEFAMAAWGDGTFVVLYEDGDYDVSTIEYQNNAPFYMAYDKTPQLINSYVKNCGGNSTITHTGYTNKHNHLWSGSRHIKKPSAIVLKPRRSKEVKGIFGFSDGIDSFKDQNTNIIKKCLDFKNTNGTFIERRAKRVLKGKAFEDDLPFDDFSFAGIIKS